MADSPKLFLNLPVRDLPRATRFYQALGFTLNPQFSGEQASCLVISEHNYVMLLVHDFFTGFLAQPLGDPATSTAALYAIACESRAAVDAMVASAVANGGRSPSPRVTWASCISGASGTRTGIIGSPSGWIRRRPGRGEARPARGQGGRGGVAGCAPGGAGGRGGGGRRLARDP